MVAKKNEAAKKESGGILSALWPFGSKDTQKPAQSSDANTSGVLAGIDQSLNQKGIDPQSRQTALKAPAADLPKPPPAAPPPTDPGIVLGSIDANLKKAGTNPDQTPQPPAAAAAFYDSEIVRSAAVQAGAANQKTSSNNTPVNEILGSIDQKLRAQGVEPTKLDAPPTPAQVKPGTAPKPQPQRVELEPKLSVEKGPLFLSPADAQATASPIQIPTSNASPPESDSKQEVASRPLVKGPIQAQASVPIVKTAPKISGPAEEGNAPGAFGQIQQDIEKASKILNPFSW